MAGLDPAIHAVDHRSSQSALVGTFSGRTKQRTSMAGSSPAMTSNAKALRLGETYAGHLLSDM